MMKAPPAAFLLALHCAGRRFSTLVITSPTEMAGAKRDVQAALAWLAEEFGAPVSGVVHRMPIGWG